MEIRESKENIQEKENILDSEQRNSLEQTLDKEQYLDKETVGGDKDTAPSLLDDDDKEDDKPDQKKDKNQNSQGSMAIGATGAVAAAVVITVVAVISSITASFAWIKAYGEYLEYSISSIIEYAIDNENPVDLNDFDTGLRLVVFNQNFTDTVALSTGNSDVTYTIEVVSTTEKTQKVKITFNGTVNGLKQNTRYKAQIIGEEKGSTKTYDSKTFKTTGLKTEFLSVDSECKCAIDGNFHFKLNYVDENNYYSNFQYTLTSKATNKVVKSGSIDNPSVEQLIYVADLSGKDFVLTITFSSLDPGDVETLKGIIEVKQDIQI